MAETQRYDATFKKVPGTLELTATHIAWVPSTPGAMDRQHQALNRVTNMLASKAGSKRVSLQLKFKDDLPAGGLLFTFTGGNQEGDRQKVQDTLIPFIAVHRGSAPAAPAGTPASANAVPARMKEAGTSSAGPSAAPTAPGTPGTPGTPASTPGTPSSVVRKRKADELGVDAVARRRMNALRERVLRKNATLKMLHRELVIGKQITEEEFWDGREALLKAEELAYAQKPGRPSRLLDDRFDLTGSKKDPKKIQGGTGVGVKKTDNGRVVVNITKELTREIFEEFPVVQDAYAKNVPAKVDEGEFWKRYFTSQLWERHRASVRKTAMDEGSRKKDDIFDVYLEDPDWETAPRKKLPDHVESYLDLAATEEDHGDATTLKDVTMQPGKERNSLPLIRRFNAHSEKLLRAGKKAPGAAGMPATDEDDLYEQIEYDDLRAPAAPAPIPLHVTDTAVKNDDSSILPGRSDADLLTMSATEASKIADWRPDFGSVCIANPANPANSTAQVDTAHSETFSYQRDAQLVATRVVRDMHQAANAELAVQPPLPEQILSQMRSCHNAASEFLRQYWSAVLPPPPGSLGGQTPQQRQQRAAKMARYLEGTEGKINAIVTTAEIARVDPERVRAALAPTLGAVNVALKRARLEVK